MTLVSRTLEKRERRARRKAELGARQRALPDKRYGVILADPPWRFKPYSRLTGMDRAADNHYPMSALEEIKALAVASIAARDCVLFLWATVPMLPCQSIGDCLFGDAVRRTPQGTVGGQVRSLASTSDRSPPQPSAGTARPPLSPR